MNSKILVCKIYVVKFVRILNPNIILAPNVLNSQGVSFFICSLKVTVLLYLLQKLIYCHDNKCD